MKNLPDKDYSPVCSFNQLCLPMDVGVLIPKDDSVRLLAFVLQQLDMQPLYEAYDAYCERRRREEGARKREREERGKEELAMAEGANSRHPAGLSRAPALRTRQFNRE
jgi:hypothetical protein